MTEILSIALQGRNADSLSQYFGEDPARCPFEQGLICFSLYVYTQKQSSFLLQTTKISLFDILHPSQKELAFLEEIRAYPHFV